jgi:hypothetical protein
VGADHQHAAVAAELGEGAVDALEAAGRRRLQRLAEGGEDVARGGAGGRPQRRRQGGGEEEGGGSGERRAVSSGPAV